MTFKEFISVTLSKFTIYNAWILDKNVVTENNAVNNSKYH